jgi:glycosyltransferase involved in cell wall biosynthesis
MYAAFLAGVPCIVSERGLNHRYTAADRALARRLALIIPMSRWIMDHMVERGVDPANIRVLYDGLDASVIKSVRPPETIRQIYGLAPHQPIIGIVGNIREWKGQETVVQALILVAKMYPDVVCFFVGAATPEDQPYLSRLQVMLKEAGVEANARFTGYQSDPASFIGMMRVLIHASVQPEPFGMVVLEGMVQRKPVVGSRAGGVIEMVVEGETGYTFPPGDANLLAARVIELLGDPDKATRMGEAGYKRLMASFTLQRYMEDMHAVYGAVLRKEPIPSEAGFGYSVK